MKKKQGRINGDLKREGSNSFSKGKIFSENTKCYPREQSPLIEINATLLIPEKYYTKFMEKIKQHMGVRAYVSHLLSKYQIHIASGMVPSYCNHTTKYQDKNQNLVKVAFRPNLDDWAELKLYRISFGMSISAFLVYLLIADFVDFEETVSKLLAVVGIPQFPNFDLWAKVFLSRKKPYYTTIFQYRKSSYG